MKHTIALFLVTMVFLASCVSRQEKERLEMENEDLRAELNRANLAVTTLEEVGGLMDSIDIARSALKLELEAGTNYEDYTARMEDINDYVKDTEAKIDILEKELSSSATKNQAYVRTVSRLKKDLADKNKEIDDLKGTVENYKQENTNLLNLVDLRESEIDDLEDEVNMKLEELDLLENRIQEMMKKAQMTEADSYFALGEALEEAARRTKLAPKKRKESYREAIEYYKKAQAFGREDAEEKIAALEKKI